MSIHHLTELQYSNDRRGPFKLYVYEPDGIHHRGGVWFQQVPRYPEEGEISTADALILCEGAMAAQRQVRICDGGDNLVFHADGGVILFGEHFWSEVLG